MTRPASPSPAAHGSRRTLLCIAAGVAAALLLGGCGQSAGRSTAVVTGPGRDRSDVTFARAMMAGEGQAQMMEGWAAGRASTQRIQAMTSRMMRSQDGWHHALRACITRGAGPSSQGMMSSHGTGSMMGNQVGGTMMSHRALKDLKTASGPEFDQLYLTMMIRHHTSMIALAAAESAGGSDPAAMRLARHIGKTQTRELTQLRRLLRR